MNARIICLLFAFVAFSAALAQNGAVFSTNEGAIKGYDPVAYFKESKAIKGSEEFSLEWQSATWYFASQNNLESFREDPNAYAPQFGGYCAYGMSYGKKYKIEPEAWKMVEGKLYLNYSKRIQEKWEKDEASFIRDAELNWKKIDQ